MKPRTRSKSSATSILPFRHVLVPTDLTERTWNALELANKLTVPGRSRITLMHVIKTIEGIQFDELKPFYDRLERKARTTMTRFARRVPSCAWGMR